MTKKLRLGNLVLGNTYRNPGLVAKIAGTIDTASQGRFTLAIARAGTSANTKRTAGRFHQ